MLGGLGRNWLVAGTVGALFAGGPLLVAGVDPVPLGVAAGVGYALVCLALWGGARVATRWSVSETLAVVSGTRPGLVAVAVLFVQGGLPVYLYARWGLVAPLGGLFVLTAVLLATFLSVGGESDPLSLYGALFGAIAVGILCALAALEVGVVRLLPPASGLGA